jgi:hypothetical protein
MLYVNGDILLEEYKCDNVKNFARALYQFNQVEIIVVIRIYFYRPPFINYIGNNKSGLLC